MLLTLSTVLLLRDEIKRLSKLTCFACSVAYPDEHWLHTFGCKGWPHFMVDRFLWEASWNLSLIGHWNSKTECDQIKSLIRSYWDY